MYSKLIEATANMYSKLIECILESLSPILGGSPTSTQEVPDGGESSRNYCEICMQRKKGHEMSKLDDCSHCFCSDCISRHVQAKIQENVHIITCPNPNCKNVIDPLSVRGIIPEIVFARWEKARSEATIPDSQKFYCPFTDCSAMLLNDEAKGKKIRESECPICHRLFCAQCQVQWHSGFTCKQFRKLKVKERRSDDLKLHVLAKENKWTKCPNCKFLVDKRGGCIHMTCRCMFEFCYKCGSKWSSKHWRCQRQECNVGMFRFLPCSTPTIS